MLMMFNANISTCSLCHNFLPTLDEEQLHILGGVNFNLVGHM